MGGNTYLDCKRLEYIMQTDDIDVGTEGENAAARTGSNTGPENEGEKDSIPSAVAGRTSGTHEAPPNDLESASAPNEDWGLDVQVPHKRDE
jgi:hypothetical protein